MAISSALLPPSTTNQIIPPQVAISLAKLIDLRSKCYKQLSELNNLKDTGILTEEEYVAEKDAVLAMLKKLKGINFACKLVTFINYSKY